MILILSIVLGMLGAILASFTGVIVERLYTGQSWSRGRSRCNSCRRQLGWQDLVPVFSLLLSRGRCRTCHSHIPLLYTFFEALLAFLFVISYLTLGLTLNLAIFLITLVVLLFIVMYDMRHTIVPWGASMLLIILSLIFSGLESFQNTTTSQFFLWSIGFKLVVAAVIGLFFFLMYFLSRGRWMGLGDTPVGFALALLVGSGEAFPGLLFSFWIGAVIGIAVLLRRRGGPRMGIELPFVPFLALGYLLAFFTQWNPLL
jgi:prepilin signal peptidase PulO-like enzyme (type II secretory pathway)